MWSCALWLYAGGVRVDWSRVANGRVFLCIAGAEQLVRRAADRRREAFRPGTRANVRSHVLLYVAFVHAFSFTDFPTSARVLQAFGEFLLLSCTAPKSVLNALGSVKHFLLDHHLDVAAFADRDLFLWRRALPHSCRHVRAQAPAMPFVLLEQLCVLSLQLGEVGVVFAALVALLFATMARLSSFLPESASAFDVTRLPTFSDVVHWEGVWQLRIKWAKAHQDAAEGFWVPLLPVGGSPACPVTRWVDLRNLSGSRGGLHPLFWCPGVRRPGASYSLPLAMPVAREWLRILLHRLGRGECGSSFHSFRRGACTRAFLQGGQEQDIRRLGGWRSDAVRAYLPVRASRRRAARALCGNVN